MKRAVSNYKACRVFLTEEASGHVTIRVAVKPVDQEWHIMHALVSHRYLPARRLADTREVLLEIADFLQQDLLPPG